MHLILDRAVDQINAFFLPFVQFLDCILLRAFGAPFGFILELSGCHLMSGRKLINIGCT